MANFSLDIKKIEKALDFGLLAGTLFLQDKIIEITPRDPKRPPKDTSRKVTGNLKRSIGHEKVSDEEYRVGIRSGYYDTEKYGAYQEFGTVRTPPRSFLRKGSEDNKIQVQQTIQKVFNQYLEK